HAACDEIRDVVGEAYALEGGLLLENGHARLEVRRLDVGDQAPLEPRAQALLDLRDVFRRRVARDDDLLARLVESVEGVEELLLRALLAGDELDVVDEQEVDVPVAPPKLRGAVVADCVDQLVGEPLGGDVDDDHSREELRALVADGVQEMRLAQADSAVDEEGGVDLRGQFGHLLTAGVSKLVRAPDDERVKGASSFQRLCRTAARSRS